MFKILGEYYYVDIDALEDYTRIDVTPSESTDETNVDDHTRVHLVKYETIKYMLEIVMDPQDEIDETIGLSSTSLSLAFKIAFNTLLSKKIINKL